MKCLVVLLISVFAFSQAKVSQEVIDLGQKLDKNYLKCVEKNNITQAQLFNLNELLKEPRAKNVQCGAACLAKEMQIMKSDNTFDITKIEQIFTLISKEPDHVSGEELFKRVHEVLDTCYPLQKGNSDECVAANKAIECILENGKKNGLFHKNL